MTTLVLGSPPPELEALLERRRSAGVDRLDEVWQGVLHVVPGPASNTGAWRSSSPSSLAPRRAPAGYFP